MFTLFFFVFIVTSGRDVEIKDKKINVNTLTLLDQVHTLPFVIKCFLW